MQCEWPFEEYSSKSTNHTHKSLSIPKIRTDGGTQPRAKLNLKTVDEYAQLMLEGLRFDPVTVFYDGTDYWLADGFHRIPAAQKAGFSTIEANIRPGTLREAILYSVAANNKNAEKLTNRDKRRSVLKLLSDPEWSQWTNSEVARQCGVAESFVRKIKEELWSHSAMIDQKYVTKCGVDQQIIISAQQWLEAQPQERIVQRQGTTYTLNTAGCGRNRTSASSRNADKQAEPATVEELPPLSEGSLQSVAQPPSTDNDIPSVSVTAQDLPSQSSLEETQLGQVVPPQRVKLLKGEEHFKTSNTFRFSNKDTEAAFQETSGNRYAGDLQKPQLRITNIDWEKLEFSTPDQALKIPLMVRVEGPSKLLCSFLDQISENPEIRTWVCNEFSNSLGAIAELVA